jgi:hypothetical protein
MGMHIPKAMEGLNFVTPPKEFLEFAKKYGVQNVVFVDDEKCERSLRLNNDIFVKITGEWDVYTLFPMYAKTYAETITLRFLHEIGHAYSQHTGSLSNTKILNISRTNDPWRDIYTGDEGEAWVFAFKIRKHNKSDYGRLISSFESFMKEYKYKSTVYWESTAEGEWKRINSTDMPTDINYCPQWVKDMYEKI